VDRDVIKRQAAMIEELTAERDGYRNGQQQMQQVCDTLQDSISKYAEERDRYLERLEKGKG